MFLVNNSLLFWFSVISLIMSVALVYKIKRHFSGIPFLWTLVLLLVFSAVFDVVLMQTFFMVQMVLWMLLVFAVLIGLIYLALRNPRDQNPEVK